MGLERCLELCPGKPSTRREHGHMVIPPCACGTPELLSCKSYLVIVIVGVQGELGLNDPEPTVRLQWLIRFMKKRGLSTQKLLISRNRWLVVLFRPWHSGLLHDLTKERRLLVSSGEHGRNGLSQIRRVRGCCHSAFNHDKNSSIIRVN